MDKIKLLGLFYGAFRLSSMKSHTLNINNVKCEKCKEEYTDISNTNYLFFNVVKYHMTSYGSNFSTTSDYREIRYIGTINKFYIFPVKVLKNGTEIEQKFIL